MSGFTYTPYDGRALPFTIGLQQLDPARWFEPDNRLAEQLAAKSALIEKDKSAVFQALPQTHAAQQELLSLMLDYLPRQYPQIYQRRAQGIHVTPSSVTLNTDDYLDKPLLLCGHLVQDDLALIEVTDRGPLLSAASLCFPSSWRLADKVGRHLDQVHGPVPGYQDKLAGKVNRMMARLPADRIIWRLNWSLDEGPELHRPAPHSHDAWLEAGADPMEHIFIRVERQTLRRLPETGYVLFTIRIYTDALAELQHHPDQARLAQGLIDQINQMDKEELSYKGLSKAAPVILASLARLIG